MILIVMTIKQLWLKVLRSRKSDPPRFSSESGKWVFGQDEWAWFPCSGSDLWIKKASILSGLVSLIPGTSGKVSQQRLRNSEPMSGVRQIRKNEPAADQEKWALMPWQRALLHCCHFFCRPLMRTGNSCVVFAQETGNISSHIRCTHPHPFISDISSVGACTEHCTRAFAISIEGYEREWQMYSSAFVSTNIQTSRILCRCVFRPLLRNTDTVNDVLYASQHPPTQCNLRAADEAVLNKVHRRKKIQKNTPVFFNNKLIRETRRRVWRWRD